MAWNCHDISMRLDDYLDGELSCDESIQWETHVAQCDDCRAASIEAQRLIDDLAMLGAIAEHQAGNSNRSTVPAKIQRRSGWLRFGTIAAAIALFVSASFLIPAGDPIKSNTHRLVPTRTAPASIATGKNQTRIEFDDCARMAIRLPSDNDRIHIYWMYDTVRPNDEEELQP